MNATTEREIRRHVEGTGSGRQDRVRVWKQSEALVRRREIVVAAPQGFLDRSSLDELDLVLGAEQVDPILIDLNECELGSNASFDRLDPSRWGLSTEQVCVICTPPANRQILAGVGVTRRLAVFGRTEDALQAKVMSERGYGQGWGIVAIRSDEARGK